MDPLFYFQAPQNPVLNQKKPQNIIQPSQNLKPGYTYQENEFFQFNQIKQMDSQIELNKNKNAFNYISEQAVSNESPKNQAISHRNPQAAIIDVWKHNLEEEFSKIMDMIEEYPLIALVNPLIFITLLKFHCDFFY